MFNIRVDTVNNRHLFIALVGCVNVQAFPPYFDHYQAVEACQKGKLDDAQPIFEQLLIDTPADSQINYNLGTVYYRKKDYGQAYDCFARSTQTHDTHVQELSYFNLGNTHVALQKLEDAVTSYEKVLQINPSNERARHNLMLVRNMLNQKQKEQEQKKQQQESQKKEQKDSSENQQKNDQSQQQDQQKKKGDNKQSQEQSSQGQDGEQMAHDSSPKDEQSGNQQNEKQEQKQGQQMGQAMASADESKQKLDKNLQAVLDVAEQQDKGHYKTMIKAHIKQEMPKQNGQKNW